MSILKNIISAIRGGTQEMGDSTTTYEGIHNLEQAIEDAKNNLNQAKHDLTELMAKEMQAGQEIDAIAHAIHSKEQTVADALAENQDTQAKVIANQIATLEKKQATLAQSKAEFGEHVQQMKRSIETTERKLTEHERQLSMVKTTENVQKATATITNNYDSTNSSLLSAKTTLAHIREQEAEAPKKPQEISPSSSDDAASAILERIKRQQH